MNLFFFFTMVINMEWENAILDSTLRSYYKSHPPSEIQIQNFDYFIHHRLPKIIEEESTIETKINERDTFRVQFQHVYVSLIASAVWRALFDMPIFVGPCISASCRQQ